MDKLIKVKRWLEGKKTYLLAVVLVLIAVAEWAGVDVPGVEVGDDPLAFVLTGLGLGSLRAGLNKKGGK